MDGLQASRHIKGDETLKHQPAIVLVTAFGREEVREEAERLQLDGFLLKPVTRSMIVDTLVNVFAEEGDAASKPAEREQDTRLRGCRILLAEDNEINQQIAIELLESAGAAVTVANNGREAVDILSRSDQAAPYDIVLMDLQMPEMDGYQATTKIRSDSRFVNLPIVAMTAHATIEERQRCLAAGMIDHIAKPIDPVALLETVGRFYRAAPAAPPAPPVLDMKAGLSRVAGNQALYQKLLRQFVDQQASAVEQIQEALARKDVALAERLAHTLKGVAGNIGATQVQSAAGVLEKAIRDGAPATDVQSAMQHAETTLAPVIAEIGAALPATVPEAQKPPAANRVVDPVESREAAVKLTTLLSDMDPAAIEHMETNHAALRPLFADAEWPAFEDLVRGYAFADAHARLEHVLKMDGV
jgi:two-component system sensor histidine kinase/response regulator